MKRLARILVIEDIPATLAGTVAKLRTAGHCIDTAENVTQALEHLGANSYDLVLLDWRLPSRHGAMVDDDAGAVILDAVEGGKEGALNANVAVVVVSAQNSGIDFARVKRFRNSIAGCIKVPVEPNRPLFEHDTLENM